MFANSWTVPGDWGPFTSVPRMHDDKIYFVDHELQVHCFDPSIPGQCWNPKTIADWSYIKSKSLIASATANAAVSNEHGF